MVHKIPKPRVSDKVERVDFSRIFGTIKKVMPPNHVEVLWQDGETPRRTKENIKDLALTSRSSKYTVAKF